jgi:hypothetical protein
VTRKFCRGWGKNCQSQLKKDKAILLERIKAFDVVAENNEMTHDQWQDRYNMEASLEQLYSFEELQLRRQSGIKWTLKGDANNSFFME